MHPIFRHSRLLTMFGDEGFDPNSITGLFFKGEGSTLSTTTVLSAPTSQTGSSTRDLQPRYIRQLNGSTQDGIVLDNTDLDITNHLTVIIRAKNDNALLAGDQFLIGKYNTTGNQREWAVGISSTELFVNLFGNGGSGAFAGQVTSDSTISNLDTTQTYIMKFTSGTVTQNINGVDVASSTTTGSIPSGLFNGTADLYIGSRNGAVYWDGEIYEVILLAGASAVPTEAQCLDIHNSLVRNPANDIQNTVYGLVGQTVAAHYKLDENTGSTFYDASGNANSGTWQNSPTIATSAESIRNYPNEVGYSDVWLQDDVLIEDEDLTGATMTFKVQTSTLTRFILFSNSGSDYFIAADPGSTNVAISSSGFAFPTIIIDGVTFTGNRGQLFTALADGDIHEVEVTGITYTGFDLYYGGSSFSGWQVGEEVYTYDLEINGVPYQGQLIPRDESNITTDVLGKPLQQTGKALSRYLVEGNNCVTMNGTTQRIDAAHLTGSETVVSHGGTATPTISAGQIDFTAGTVAGLVLSDGTIYPVAEGSGATVFDVSGNGNNGTLINSPTWSTQNSYAYNFTNGCNRYMDFAAASYVRLSGFTATGNYFGACTISADVYIPDASATAIICSLGTSAYRVYINGGNWILNGGENTGVSASTGWQNISVEFNSSGEAISLTIEGAEVWTGTAVVGVSSTTFDIGARSGGLLWNGIIANFSLSGSSVTNFTVNGYGATDAHWVDTTGNGNNGTIFGSPLDIYIPAQTATTDVFGDALRGTAFNGSMNACESALDFVNTGVGGVAIPETAFMDASFATVEFDEDWSSFDYAFYREPTAYLNDRHTIFTAALTGTDLTKMENYTS